MIAALVPAAGLSARMGRPKLLLDVHGQPLIQRVIRALKNGGADRVLVIAPPIHQEGSIRIQELAADAGAETTHLVAPTVDMRSTIEAGLLLVTGEFEPPSGVLIAPGDSVGMTSGLVAAVVRQFLTDPSRIIVPEREGRRGHPLALPWTVAMAIRNLPRNVGVNALLSAPEARVDRLLVAFPDLDADLDTPEDYRRWSGA
ncbi:MAG: putative MobA-like protein [Planctomycetota bacterium]|nr:putative MobA-like protein [Planctomycetota bacterium]